MRKQPHQARARQRVDALIDAAAQEIADRGLLETTTNHIAARAGVSIGSLYQYFEDKNDLVTMLVRRLSSEIAEAAQATLATSIAADVHTVVRQLLGTALNMVDERPALYLELTRNWQMQGTLTVIESLETHLMDAWGRYLLHHHDELAVTNLSNSIRIRSAERNAPRTDPSSNGSGSSGASRDGSIDMNAPVQEYEGWAGSAS